MHWQLNVFLKILETDSLTRHESRQVLETIQERILSESMTQDSPLEFRKMDLKVSLTSDYKSKIACFEAEKLQMSVVDVGIERRT